MTKWILSLIAVCALGALLCGCSSAPEESPTPPPPAAGSGATGGPVAGPATGGPVAAPAGTVGGGGKPISPQ